MVNASQRQTDLACMGRYLYEIKKLRIRPFETPLCPPYLFGKHYHWQFVTVHLQAHRLNPHYLRVYMSMSY